MIQIQKFPLRGLSAAAALTAILSSVAADDIRDAVTLYASFDKQVRADFGGGADDNLVTDFDE